MNSDRLRVLSLNIWNRQGPWAERLPIIQQLLQSLDPDVVGLQEVMHLDGAPEDQAQEVARDRPYHVAFASAWHIGNGLQFGNAVLSRYPITTAQSFPLPGESGEETRSLLYCELDTPFGKVPFFNTHLNWRLDHGHVRERQVAAIVDEVQRLAPSTGFPAILVGDFNAEPDSTEIRYLKGLTSLRGRSVYFGDCFGAVGQGPGYTFSRANRFAASVAEPNRRIDYIFTQGPDRKLRGEPLVARVVGDQAVGEHFASDHFGVYAEISAQPRALHDGT